MPQPRPIPDQEIQTIVKKKRLILPQKKPLSVEKKIIQEEKKIDEIEKTTISEVSIYPE